MIYLFRWLFGYVRFSFKNGFVEDFLSDCFSQGLELRNIESSGEYITACCNLKNYKKLHTIAYHHGGVVKIIKKKGLPFVLLPLKKRTGFFVGIVCFCAIISFLNAFIWNVEIVGNETISDTTIMAYLENNNLKCGSMWSSVDKEKLSWNMMSEFDEFSWVHINKFGTTAQIEVNEVRSSPQADNDKLQGKDVFRKELSVTVNREQKDIAVKDIKRYYNLNFFTADIPLYIKRQKGEETQKSTEKLKIKGIELPIGYTEYDERFFSSAPHTLDDDELKALAQKRLSYQERDEFGGFEIVNKTEDYQLDESKCVATFSYIIRRK